MNTLKPKEPIYTEGYDKMVEEIVATGPFETIETKFSTSQTNDYDPEHEVDIKLINGAALPADEKGMDSLARVVGGVVKRSIKNINDYHFVTVIFEDIKNGVVVERTGKNIFVFRPKEL